MDRQIIHIDISAFAVSVERVRNAQLRGRPVIVAFPDMARAQVYATSGEARAAGIKSGMSLQLARKLCRDIVVVPPDQALYSRATHAILKILAQFTPTIEPLGYGHAYLDMTGTTRLFGATKDAAAKVQREIQSNLRLESTAGVASNKLVSKIASAVVKPVSLQDVASGAEKNFIAPLNVNYLPHITPQIKQQLLDFNIQIIRQLAEISLSQLTIAFGRAGLLLHQAALGIDHTPVLPPQQIPNIFEEHTLPEDSNDFYELRGILYRLIERAAFRLRQEQRMAKMLALEIAYSDHKNAYGQKKIPAPANLESTLFPAAETLFNNILKRRTRVRKIAIRLFHLLPETKQLSLLQPEPKRKDERLSQAIDDIRGKFGSNAVQLAMGLH